MFLAADGVTFGELAARPPGGHLMELLRRAYGFDAWEALLRIALGERPELPRTAGHAAGVWLLHPGAGTLAKVTGVEEARGMPGVVDLPLRAAIGDDVAARAGVGQELGHVTVVGRDRAEVARCLVAAHDAIGLELA